MKAQSKVLLVMACLVLAIPMTAGAAPVGTFTSELNPTAPGQTFYGDGSVFGSGYLQAPPPNNKGDRCLQCHQGIPADFNPNVIIPDKSSYLRTGHGNMLKKVSPNQVWRGVTKEPHPFTNPFGHVIDWSTGSGRVNLGGFCDVGGFEGQFDEADCVSVSGCTLAASDFPLPAYTRTTCEAAGGQWRTGNWTPAERWVDIIYFVGDWMGSAAGHVDTGITGPTLPANKFMQADGRAYNTCGSCHNAGYLASDYTRPQPFTDYPNFPRSRNAGVAGSWVLDGIQCERCHDATQHYAAPYTATVNSGASSTALCSQCHIRAGAWEKWWIPPAPEPTPANPKWATQPTAYPLGASATAFSGHTAGKQFLNSPHAKFTGTVNQITTASLYNSHFSEGTCSVPGEYFSRTTCQAAGGTWTSTIQGGCTTCHDVHQSTLPDAKKNFGAEPMKNACGIACHASRADFTTINHPSGTGTPMDEGTEAACVSCHMPGGMHVFRISTDPSYSTFPKQIGGVWTPGICSDPSYTTRDACVAAGKSWSGVANSAPESDGTYPNAVWVDLDLACGKCHGGGADGSGALIYPLTKTQLAEYAKGMHAGVSPNQAPVIGQASAITVNGTTATLVDNSTCGRQHTQSELEVTVNWGDWSVSKGKAGTTFTHNYNKKGKFKVTHTVKEPHGLQDGHKEKVIVK